MKKKPPKPQNLFLEIEPSIYGKFGIIPIPKKLVSKSKRESFGKTILELLHQKDEKLTEIREAIVGQIALYENAKSRWTKERVKYVRNSFSESLTDCRKLSKDLAELDSDDCRTFIIDYFAKNKDRYPFQGITVRSKEYLIDDNLFEIIQEFLLELSPILASICDKIPNITGRENVREIKGELIHELIHLFYHFFIGPQPMKRRSQCKFVAIILKNFDIENSTDIDEIIEAETLPSSSGNALLKMIDSIHSAYKKTIKSPRS